MIDFATETTGNFRFRLGHDREMNGSPYETVSRLNQNYQRLSLVPK